MKKLLLLALLLPAVGCVAARAQVQPEDHPALVVPPVPPRVIEPLPAEAPPLEPVGELPTAPSNPPRPRPQNREPNRPAATDSKTEAKPADAPPADPVATTQTQPNAQPVPPLRTPGTPNGPEMSKQVRDTLDRANKILGSVDYQALKSDSRANYENAKSFMKQAEDALKANNTVAAKLLADRAENIAKQLAGG
jgi:hypothetical protein